MEERLIKLETISAMQDETIAKLNREIFMQQQDIGRLRRHITALERRLDELSEPGEIGGIEKPPHY